MRKFASRPDKYKIVKKIHIEEGKEKIKNLSLFAFLFLCLVGGFIIFNDKIQDIFASVYKAGTDDSGRIEIYENGLKQFKESPIFGKGFYE